MLEALIVLLVVLWALGYWGPYREHAGNHVHLLLLTALVVLIARVLR